MRDFAALGRTVGLAFALHLRRIVDRPGGRPSRRGRSREVLGMADFLRRHFWGVELVVIGVLAGLGAHAARHVLEARFLPDAMASSRPTAGHAPWAPADGQARRGAI